MPTALGVEMVSDTVKAAYFLLIDTKGKVHRVRVKMEIGFRYQTATAL